MGSCNFLPIIKVNNASDFRAEVTCGLFCGFIRDIAVSPGQAPRDPTLAKAANIQPAPSVGLTVKAASVNLF